MRPPKSGSQASTPNYSRSTGRRLVPSKKVWRTPSRSTDLASSTSWGKASLAANCIESLMGEVDGYIDDVKRWHHSPQRHRWMALAVIEAEGRFRRLNGYDDLPRLQAALKEVIPDDK